MNDQNPVMTAEQEAAMAALTAELSDAEVEFAVDAVDAVEATAVAAGERESMTQEAQINLYSNKDGAMIETRFPTGEIDEKNMLHVFAWWIAENMGALLPTAITDWHKRRTELAQAGGAAPGDAAPEPALVTPMMRLVDEGGRPIGA